MADRPALNITALLFTVIAILLPGRNASADQTIRICIGEDQANGCPVSKDAMFGCGTSIDVAASQVCATKDGRKTVSPYRAIHQGSHDGGRCGYEWYLVTCLGQ
jgi:hypothetical protein